MPGAVMVLTAADFPANGVNNFVPLGYYGYDPEPVSNVFIDHTHK